MFRCWSSTTGDRNGEIPVQNWLNEESRKSGLAPALKKVKEAPMTPNLRSEKRMGDGRNDRVVEGATSRRKYGMWFDSMPKRTLEPPEKYDSRERKHLNRFANGRRASIPRPGLGWSMIRKVGRLVDGRGRPLNGDKRDCRWDGGDGEGEDGDVGEEIGGVLIGARMGGGMGSGDGGGSDDMVSIERRTDQHNGTTDNCTWTARWNDGQSGFWSFIKNECGRGRDEFRKS